VKILHIASFVGNIGDNISHFGLGNILNHLFSEYSIERLEIRKFYKNYSGTDKCHFDEAFLKKIESFDLCLIGGGGFLDYWVDGSASGTTIDMSHGIVEQIRVPMLICSVGCIPHRPVPEGNIEKLQRFLDACERNPAIKIIVRNDGSVSNLKRLFGGRYKSLISEGLDNALFVNEHDSFSLPVKGDYVALNIASDQLVMESDLRGPINAKVYYEQLAKVVSHICETRGLNLVLVPHIYGDLESISALLRHVDDYLIRAKVSVAPCVQCDAGANAALSVYGRSLISIGMRFHANIMPTSLGKVSLGLVALDRVKHMYDSLGMHDNYVFVDYEFSGDLNSKIDRLLDTSDLVYFRDETKIVGLKDEGLASYRRSFESIGLSSFMKRKTQ
jgi:polysaccharide pyruvyl transferase WcaK-like protein